MRSSDVEDVRTSSMAGAEIHRRRELLRPNGDLASTNGEGPAAAGMGTGGLRSRDARENVVARPITRLQVKQDASIAEWAPCLRRLGPGLGLKIGFACHSLEMRPLGESSAPDRA